MPWCPNCREEYRQGFKTCSDCGSELVDELPPLEEHVEAVEMNCICDTLLTTTVDCYQAEVIESYLNAERIPVVKVVDSLGVNIYVPQTSVEEARSIVDNVKEIADENGQPIADENEDEEHNRIYREKRRSALSGNVLWCPVCRMEYRQGYRLCSDCGAKLVDNPTEFDEENESKENDEINSFCDAYLTTVADCLEAEMIESYLNEDGIPVVSFASGSGVDIYVPEELLEEARDIFGSARANARDNKRTSMEDAGLKEPAPLSAVGSGRRWCPKCRVEYWQEGIDVCSDCGAKLVDPAKGM